MTHDKPLLAGSVRPAADFQRELLRAHQVDAANLSRKGIQMQPTFDWIFFGIMVPPLLFAAYDLFKTL